MDGARQQLLACPGLALDEHGGVGGRYRFNLLEHGAQPGTLADDVFKAVVEIDLLFEVSLLLVEPLAELRDLLESDGIVYRHGHLSGYLEQQVRVALGECALFLTEYRHRTQRPLTVGQRDPDAGFHSHRDQGLHRIERERPALHIVEDERLTSSESSPGG